MAPQASALVLEVMKVHLPRYKKMPRTNTRSTSRQGSGDLITFFGVRELVRIDELAASARHRTMLVGVI